MLCSKKTFFSFYSRINGYSIQINLRKNDLSYRNYFDARYWLLYNKLNNNLSFGNSYFNKIKNLPGKSCFYTSVTHSHNTRQFLKINTGTFLAPISSQENNQGRGKSTKKGQKRPEYDSDSDSDQEEENIQGTKIVTAHMQSLRLDGVLKKSLNVARNKAETAFYEGRVRVNGKKPDKKSFQVKIGDEVDWIKGFSPLNNEFVNVSRIEILSVDESDEDNLLVKMRRTKTMVIENYEDHPWKKENTSSS